MIPEKVHLVGAVGLDSVEEVFRSTGGILGRRLRRVPDGEPGGRRMWISWQYPVLRINPFLKASSAASPIGFFFMELADGIGPDELRFGELGYSREARTSYQDFLGARKRGEIQPDVRFEVTLPTPLAVVGTWCPGKDIFAIENAYEKAMMREVAKICDSIPHRDLCLQWDTCPEMIMWDRQLKDRLPPFKGELEQEILARMKRISDAVPDDVELGYHLCYGDWEAKHSVQPIDAGKLVGMANALAKTVKHPISYIHMPVPINRTDDAYFKPLSGLKLAPNTEIYLGLVHVGDGLEGTKKRIAVASNYLADFGIATECGLGRCKTPEIVLALLRIHADASREPERVAI